MFCPKCGTKNIDEARFCGACGTPLDANAGMPAPRAANAFAPAPQVARVQQSAATGGKNALPLLIAGAAASFIVVVLIVVFVVVPAFNENFNKNPFKGCQKGDVVEFGSYEQDGDISNGKEPIEWRVLSVTGDRALVVSQKALDAQAYYEDEDELEDCFYNLDAWLENDFASQAFTGDGMKVIDEAPRLLFEEEATDYFMSDEDRICMPTQQAINNGAWIWDDNGACGWWLDSSWYSGLYGANFVGADGVVDSDGRNVPSTDLAIRPAMEVNL